MIQEHSCPQEAGGDSNPASPLDQTEERIGQAFRRMREHYGESQRAVAAALKISVDQLDSLEKGAYERLPGRVYILGWARAYASYLGLDVHDTLSYLKRELKEGEDCPTAARTELLWTERFSHIEKSVPQWSIALASVIGLAVLYGILAIWNRDDLNNEKLSSVDLPTFQTATEFEARAINKDNDSEFSTQSVSPSLLDGHKGEVENEELTPSSSSLSSIHANSAGIPLTGSLEAGNIVRSLDQPHKEHNLGGGTDLSGSSTRIRLLANEPSWVSIRDTLNQKTLLTQIMEKGDIFDVPFPPRSCYDQLVTQVVSSLK